MHACLLIQSTGSIILYLFFWTDAPFAAPINLTCENATNGFTFSWRAVCDTSCTMIVVVYLISVIREHDMVAITSMNTTETEADIISPQVMLEPGINYIISVEATVNSCGGESANITCETNPSLPTQPPGTCK